ncbi:MAG: glycosyltransferase family 4 protein [Alphaproteobacteria bacterium]|nr:glycosyltransferase family 4 protein [Alphaproteobacteria bacterium]
MKIAFIDFVYHYDAARPEKDEPLGGTTSAVCFLARELQKSGVACTFFNRVTAPCAAHGIASLPLPQLGDEIERGGYDAYIFCGRWSRELVELVRAHTKKPLIAWMHESAFAHPFTPALDAFDGVVYVSDWQQRVNAPSARPHWRQTVIRNAMNPAVAASFPAGADILPAKSSPPVFLFAGSFARGAFHIAPLLEKIRPHCKDFLVEMYCNLDPSRDPEKDAAYIDWLRGLPNIAHVGMVGQGELAARMKRASVFLAPNPWPETSCIALIEALASGLSAVATSRAALPETAAGFARLIPIDAPDDQTRFDMPIDYDAFAAHVVDVLRSRDESALRRQVDFFHAHYQWSQRVAPWTDFLCLF